MGGEGAQRRLLILPHQPAIAVDVGAEDGCKLTLHSITRPAIICRLCKVCQFMSVWSERG